MRDWIQHYDASGLWDYLAREERDLGWLARKTGYTHQYLRLMRIGQRPVTERVAHRVSEVLAMDLSDLFVPVESHKWDRSSQRAPEAVA
jgi:hypothetical protein